MKIILKNILGFSALLLMLAGCKKEVEPTFLKEVNFSSVITSSSSDVILKEENDDETALTISWSEVTFPVTAPVTYTLQADVPADTLTATPWSKASSIEVGEDVLSKSLTVKELNDLVVSMGLDINKADLLFRVKASMDRDVYSAPVVVAVTPYLPAPPAPVIPSLWVPGAYQGWNPAIAPTIGSANSDGVYEGYLDLPVGEFKLTAQPAWEPMAYGDNGDENLMEANFPGGNFTMSTAGYYFIYANLNTMKYKFIKTSWGIIGAATPTGWDSDTDLIYNPQTKKWSVTLNLTGASSGSFKFRANDAWLMALGQKNGKIAYSDNPVYPYDSSVSDFTVPENGNYTITLDFNIPGDYKYTIKKN